ncbi:GTP pyrophosphokinase family protein [Micromonospora chersina]|uniref:GTP pyrophosphokinase n=1 Tax=Micromonospora chersina TaxID=47854 RepID=UPI0033C60701
MCSEEKYDTLSQQDYIMRDLPDDEPSTTGEAPFTDVEWDAKTAPLRVFGPSMESLLAILISNIGIVPHSVNHRIKFRKSVARKIEDRARADYTLDSLTDILGLRVITYFDQEVDKVAEMIESEFTVDRENSVDKRKALDPDRFGYLSLHYVVQLHSKRMRLAEYSQFKQIKFEIQVRSILQHAWAEIEHDLGYKSNSTIPAPIRRRFSRLAGLLELADIEFTRIREDVSNYEETVEAAVRDRRLDAAIDRESINAYVKESSTIRDLEAQLVQATNLSRRPAHDPAVYSARRADNLTRVGFQSLEELDRFLRETGQVMWRFARNWLMRKERASTSRRRYIPEGVILHYVILYFLSAMPREEALKLLASMKIGYIDIDDLIQKREEAEREWERFSRDAHNPSASD